MIALFGTLGVLASAGAFLYRPIRDIELLLLDHDVPPVAETR